jgi:hypothetical protein
VEERKGSMSISKAFQLAVILAVAGVFLYLFWGH